MNAAGLTAGRIYQSLKTLVLGGAVRPGARLDPALIADELSSSVTPVRAALNMLIGEGLVETGTGEGFHLPLLDEPALKDRYMWNADLLGLVLRRTAQPGEALTYGPEQDVAARTAAVFTGISRWTSNIEHVAEVQRMNDRLHAVRVAESDVLGSIGDELDGLVQAIVDGDRGRLRALIAAYHRRRIRGAAAILRHLYRMADPAE